MKKILCIISGMNAGGAETFLMKIYRQIDKTKCQMDFAVNIDTKGFYDDEIISYGGKILRFPAKSKSLFRYIVGLKKIVQDGEYNTVLRITSNAMGFLDLAVAKLAGAKICVARSSNSSDGNSLGSKISHWLGGWLFKRFVDVMIAPSSEAAIYTFGEKDFKRGAVHILPNGLDLDYYSYTEKGRAFIREKFGIASNQTVLGHVGRFTNQKNHFFLLKIFQQYHKINSNSILLLVGEGELKKEIQRKVVEMGLEKNVLFAGVCSDMPSLYSAMDVFVFPSLYEGLPNTVIEAQVCGLPCVVSNTVTKEVNVSQKIVFLPIGDNDVQQWVEKIDESLVGRLNCRSMFADYDIRNVVVAFQKYIWGDYA